MKKENFNGFRTEKDYENALKLLNDVQGREDIYDRDTLAVYLEEGRIEFNVDNYQVAVWDNQVEVYLNKVGMTYVDGGIVAIAAKLLEMLREGELDFIFYSKDPDEKPKEDFGEMPF